jgi:hypothetical protein
MTQMIMMNTDKNQWKKYPCLVQRPQTPKGASYRHCEEQSSLINLAILNYIWGKITSFLAMTGQTIFSEWIPLGKAPLGVWG